MSTRTLIIIPHIKSDPGPRSIDNQSSEASGLAHAIDLEVINVDVVNVRSIIPATFIGKGKISEIKGFLKSRDIDLVIFNRSLSPIQQRNLEKGLDCKVIDRTALILEIFGERAKTKEGSLQVELAALEYQKSRLVRSWTHLERQRGGLGFVGGPGETQIEIDRRLINDRITKIKKQLDKVKNTRTLHRKSRDKVPYPTIALVGYTNAGKSTLFNYLSGAKVFAKDLLFATLDPTMREIKLPSGNKVILSDTVGFISDLPTELIASFRATLEEVIEADLILHVRDIHSEDSKEQMKDVIEVLTNLGVEEQMNNSMITVLNKIDLIDGNKKSNTENEVYISATTGEGCDLLLKKIDELLSKRNKKLSTTIDSSNGKLIAWIHQHGQNTKTKIVGDKVKITSTLSEKNYAKFRKMNR